MPAKRSQNEPKPPASKKLVRQIKSAQKELDVAERKHIHAIKQKYTYLDQLYRKMTAKKGVKPSAADVAKAKEIKKRETTATTTLKKQQAKVSTLVNKWMKTAPPA